MYTKSLCTYGRSKTPPSAVSASAQIPRVQIRLIRRTELCNNSRWASLGARIRHSDVENIRWPYAAREHGFQNLLTIACTCANVAHRKLHTANTRWDHVSHGYQSCACTLQCNYAVTAASHSSNTGEFKVTPGERATLNFPRREQCLQITTARANKITLNLTKQRSRATVKWVLRHIPRRKEREGYGHPLRRTNDISPLLEINVQRYTRECRANVTIPWEPCTAHSSTWNATTTENDA